MSKSLISEIIRNSDDGGDSDSSLEDLSVLLARRIPATRIEKVESDLTASIENSYVTTRSSRLKKSPGNLSSTENKPEYKYDFKSLAKSTQSYDATEASSNRVREMIESHNKITDQIMIADDIYSVIPSPYPDKLLRAAAACARGVRQDTYRIRHAVEETEIKHGQKRWYFFDSHSKSKNHLKRPFPTSCLSEIWKSQIGNTQSRKYAFLSGFAEDMIILGKTLPDEVFLWLVENACFEKCNVLRDSYFSVLAQSHNQIQRLLGPEMITDMFLYLNSSSGSTCLKEKIKPVTDIPGFYSDYDWSALLSTLNFFSRTATTLQRDARMHLSCLLFRMCVDTAALENIDVFNSVQKTLDSICKSNSPIDWEQFCQETCGSIFHCVNPPNLRLQIVNSISSASVNSHDLKRRLASCFIFDDLIFAQNSSRNLISFPMFLGRLRLKDFQSVSGTDYCQLKALIMLMDIAIDDGQSSNQNLTDRSTEEAFNKDVDNFSLSVREILGGMKMQGTPNIAVLQAKEAIEAFSQRIIHTMRTKPRSVHEWFLDSEKMKNKVDGDRNTMESFVARASLQRLGARKKLFEDK